MHVCVGAEWNKRACLCRGNVGSQPAPQYLLSVFPPLLILAPPAPPRTQMEPCFQFYEIILHTGGEFRQREAAAVARSRDREVNTRRPSRSE